MEKLVLGIIAVTLVQIAFFVYMATDEPAYTNARPVKTGPVEKSPQLSRASDPPEVVPSSPAPAAIPTLQQKKVKTSAVPERWLAGRRTRPIVRDLDRAAPPPARVVAMAPATSARSSREWDVPRRRSGRLIPSGYTMALVDYPPTAARIKTPIAAGSKTSTVARIQTEDISKPRKRSLIARAIPALVKKPWNFIKSVASKLD